MKYIVIKKTGNPSNDYSCENIIRFTSRMYRYSDRNIKTTANFIIARIPDKQGDFALGDRFFERVPMYISDPPKGMPYDEMKRLADGIYQSKDEIGQSLILKTVNALLPKGGWDIFDM